MKIEITEGCICTGMDVDGTPISELNKEQFHEVRKTLCEYILKHKDDISLFDLGKFVVQRCESEYFISDICECCGDSVETWKMEV